MLGAPAVRMSGNASRCRCVVQNQGLQVFILTASSRSTWRTLLPLPWIDSCTRLSRGSASAGQGDRFEDAQPSCIDHLKQHAVSLGGAAHPSPIVGGGAGELRPVRSDFSAYGSAIGTDEDRVLARLSLAPTRDLAIPGADRDRHPGQHGEAQQGGHNRSHDHSPSRSCPPEEEEQYRTEATT
jgi:hypothetical protein